MKNRRNAYPWWDGDVLARLPTKESIRFLKVLYEDNHVMAVYKPAGLLSQGRSHQSNLHRIVVEYIREKYNKPGKVYLAPIHRLDRPVCGILLFAKTSKGARRLSQQMREGTIKKIYMAITLGIPDPPSGDIFAYLRKRSEDKKMLVVSAETHQAVRAMLQYRLVEKADGCGLLEVFPLTGRKHQIRALLAHIGCPIYGDCKYGVGPKRRSGIALLAYIMEFKHPTKDEVVKVKSPIPPNWPWPPRLNIETH